MLQNEKHLICRQSTGKPLKCLVLWLNNVNVRGHEHFPSSCTDCSDQRAHLLERHEFYSERGGQGEGITKGLIEQNLPHTP